jgi:hypothetical protein
MTGPETIIPVTVAAEMMVPSDSVMLTKVTVEIEAEVGVVVDVGVVVADVDVVLVVVATDLDAVAVGEEMAVADEGMVVVVVVVVVANRIYHVTLSRYPNPVRILMHTRTSSPTAVVY